MPGQTFKDRFRTVFLSGMIVVMAVAMGFAVSAEEDIVNRYGAILTTCYAEASDSETRSECVGRMSDECIAREKDGQSTHGSVRCIRAEGELWDWLLNREYRATLNWAGQLDVQDAELFPELAYRARALRAAQRAWITFRDTECGFDYAVWGAGTMRLIAGADCMMRMTAQRTIELREKREVFE